MAEGGTLAWKRQVVHTSRGPAASYKNMALPDLPEGVVWQQNTETKEWTVVTADPDSKQRRKYKMERATIWNPRTNREELTVRMRPVDDISSSSKKQSNNLKQVGKTAAGDDETVATEADNSTYDYYFNEDDIGSDYGVGNGNDGNDNDDDNNNVNIEGPPEPVLGVDYVVHTVLPSDTFQGLCLRYKIKAMELRQVNRFSGTNLALAPSHLIIPLNTSRNLQTVKLQDTTSNEYKLQLVLAEWPHLPFMERKAYLEMNDWDVDAALKEIQNDAAWEQDQKDVESMQIKIAKQLSTKEQKSHKTTVTSSSSSTPKVTQDQESSLITPLLDPSVKPFEVDGE